MSKPGLLLAASCSSVLSLAVSAAPTPTTRPTTPASRPATTPAADPVISEIERVGQEQGSPDRVRAKAAHERLQAIVADAEAAAAAKPNDARRQYVLGVALYYFGKDVPSLAALERAVALAPAEPDHVYMRGVLLLEKGDAAKGVESMTTATRLAPKSTKYWLALASAQEAAGDTGKAIEAARTAMDLDPANARSRSITAGLLLDSGKTAEALDLFRKAVAIDPDYVLAHFNIGQLLQNQGEHETALVSFKTVTRLAPDDDRARAKVVQCLQALGRTKERDAERDALFALHRAGKIKAPHYCREQFAEGKERVMVFEYFQLTGPRAIRYSFVVLDEAGRDTRYRVSLGSYEMTTQIARETGSIGKDERMFHLDRYDPDGSHATFGMFPAEPTYDRTREMVLAVMKGTVQPGSAMKPRPGGGGDIKIAPQK